MMLRTELGFDAYSESNTDIIAAQVEARDPGYALYAADNLNAAGLWVSHEILSDLLLPEDTPERFALRALWKSMVVQEGIRPAADEGFSADKWSFCVIKPDAKELRLEDEIYERIGDSGLVIEDLRETVELSETDLDRIWPPPIDEHGNVKPPSLWWKATVDYMTSAPVDMMLLRGEGASDKIKTIKADLRAEQYGDNYQKDETLPYSERVRSIIHTSDGNPELFVNALAFWEHGELAQIVGNAGIRKVADIYE